MKKTIGKPENWQDFESLCKKLWGEIWNISDSIKKNGRLGQTQYGVDVYGIPKGENTYRGIQCKGKDDYSNGKLTISEIDSEIEKAKNFVPNLSVYIIATTANKDAKVEEYIRVRDIENRSNSFEIHYFCWEDIVDLLEECSDTYNWYLNGIGQKDKYDFKVSFNNFGEDLILKPTFEKNKTRYILARNFASLQKLNIKIPSSFEFIKEMHFSSKINKSWCNFEIVLENTGKKVIDDWHFKLNFPEGVRKIYNEFESIYTISTPLNLRRVYVSDDEKSLKYYPLNNEPLIQKDRRIFEMSILANHNVENIFAEWELLARDFNVSGKLKIVIEPEYIEKTDWTEVNSKEYLRPDEIRISDHVVDESEDDSNENT